MIQDNLVFDTTGEGLAYYGRSELLLMKQRPDDALKTLDSIQALFAGHSLTDDVLWKKAQIYRQTKRYDQARESLEKILANHKTDIYGDDALFALAEIEEKDLKNKPRAMELYEQVLKDFPGSIYGAESRKRFRTLRGDAL
jgi:tetratricopeptide (TPR) repeat protein